MVPRCIFRIAVATPTRLGSTVVWQVIVRTAMLQVVRQSPHAHRIDPTQQLVPFIVCTVLLNEDVKGFGKYGKGELSAALSRKEKL